MSIRQLISVQILNRARIGQVSPLDEVRTFVEFYPFHGFRDEEIQVGVALAVCVADHVNRQTIDKECDVCPVIIVEAAQKILHGFAATGVLPSN